MSITIGGASWAGFTQAIVDRRLDSVADACLLRTANPRTRMTAWPFAPDAECVVSFGSETLLTGRVDSVAPYLGGDAGHIMISASSLTADLIDCSAPCTPGQWTAVPLAALVSALAAPFGVAVVCQVTADPFPAFAINPGETAFAAIERACRMRGALATCDAAGQLVIMRAGAERVPTAIVSGENVLEAMHQRTRSGRYGSYTVLGQRPGSDVEPGALASEVTATVTDPGCRAARSLTLVAEGPATPAGALARATWEASVRAARASRLHVSVVGWEREPAGAAWAPNMIARAVLPEFGIDADLLIEAARLCDGDLPPINGLFRARRGRRAELTLVRPDAYAATPPGATETWT